MPYLGTESHGFTTLFTMITFKTHALFLVNSHMRIPVLLTFVFIWTRVTFIPEIFVALYVSVQVPFVLKATVTTLMFAHETEVILMRYPVLFQPALKRKALSTVLTNKMCVHTMCVQMFFKGCLGRKFLITQLTVNNTMVLSVMSI